METDKIPNWGQPYPYWVTVTRTGWHSAGPEDPGAFKVYSSAEISVACEAAGAIEDFRHHIRCEFIRMLAIRFPPQPFKRPTVPPNFRDPYASIEWSE